MFLQLYQLHNYQYLDSAGSMFLLDIKTDRQKLMFYLKFIFL